MIGRTEGFRLAVAKRYDASSDVEAAYELACRDKLARHLSTSAHEIDAVLENRTLTVREMSRLFPFDQYRRGKAILDATHRRKVQVVDVSPTEADIEAALSGSGDDVGILSPPMSEALVLVVTIDRALRRQKDMFTENYIPTRLMNAVVARIQGAIGATMSFGFRLHTGAALVYRFNRPVDSAVLAEEGFKKLASTTSKVFTAAVSFGERKAFFVPERGRMVGPDLLPRLYDPAGVQEHDPRALFPNIDRPRTPVVLPPLEPPPPVKDADLLQIMAALLTHFPRRRRQDVEDFLARLFDWIRTRERTQYSKKHGVGTVAVSSRMLKSWNSDYSSIIEVAVDNSVILVAANHSSGSKCYTAHARFYRLNRAANVPVVDRPALALHLGSSGIDRSTLAERLGIAGRTLSRWLSDPERIPAQKAVLIAEIVS